jgi:hypothetical protein
MQLAKLKARIGRGEYAVDPLAVAGAMVRRMEETGFSLWAQAGSERVLVAGKTLCGVRKH